MKQKFLSSLFLMTLVCACSTWSMPWNKSSSSSSDSLPTPSAYYEPSTPQNKNLIRSLESKLTSKKEKEQYSKILPWLQNDQERIDFLQLTDLESRQKWIMDQKIWSRPKNVNSKLSDLAESGDIALGMPQELVRRSWGEPQIVEVSGNPAFKNERWKYMKHVSTPDGFKPEQRTVYFEGGKVVGWETN